MISQIQDSLYKFEITLPRSPLKYLNCYVIKPKSGRSLLIDAGYAIAESREDLDNGIKELGLSPEDTDVFITHIHADHSGNAKYLADRGYRVFISEKDYEGVIECNKPAFFGARQKAEAAGTPEAVYHEMFVKNPAPITVPELFAAETVRPYEVLNYGPYAFQCLPTYGHSPGHMSLYDENSGTIILGDHVLFDITPNIVLWNNDDDALGAYLDSLRMTGSYYITTALPGHRMISQVSVYDRIDELIGHHNKRMEEIRDILVAEPLMCAYRVASRMKWSLRAASWEDFPASQKYFAVCECMAHLKHMCRLGMIDTQLDPRGLSVYYAL